MVLSPTRIRSWLQCQLQYKFTYIDHLSGLYYKPNRFDTFGATLHRTLQMFHEAGGASAMSAEQLVSTYESCWVSAGFESAVQEKQERERGLEIIQRYWQGAVAAPVVTLGVEKQLRHKYATFTLMGRLDRLDEHPDGTLEIIDYKSCITDIAPEEVHDSIAMKCYALLVRKHFPKRPVVATIIGLVGGCKASTSFSLEDLEVFEETAHQVAAQVQNREEFLPSYSPGCAACIYAKRCLKGTLDWESARTAFEQEDLGAW